MIAIPLAACSAAESTCLGDGAHMLGSQACWGDGGSIMQGTEGISLMQASTVVEKRARKDAAVGAKIGMQGGASLISHKHEGGAIHEHARAKSSESSGVGASHGTKEEAKSKMSSTEWGGVLVAVGFAAITFSVKSINRTKAELNEITAMDEANTDAKSLQDASAAGELPSKVIIKGVLSADGPDVTPAAPSIAGLSDHVNEIEQPENALVSIAQAVKRGDDGGQLSGEVEKQTGIKASDIPDVEDDFTKREADFKEGPCVLAECLVARLGVMTYKVKKDSEESNRSAEENKRITVKRSERKHSYNAFHARRFSEGLHLLDANGQRMDLELPEANVVKMLGLGEQPSLFLATADVLSEFGSSLRKEGLTVNGQHVDLSNMPPTQVSEPATMLSKFIFMDVQSPNDLGLMPSENPLGKIATHYGRDKDGKDFLWEPKGFYDYEREVSTRATFSKRELVSADEMLQRAKKAAEENHRITDFCEPTFTREEVAARRDQENCFRFTELAVPRGAEVTVLARPEPNGKGGFKLVPPSDAENGRSSDDPEAERYRLRILKGHTVENLKKQRSVNLMQYYGLAVVGAFLVLGGGGTIVTSMVD